MHMPKNHKNVSLYCDNRWPIFEKKITQQLPWGFQVRATGSILTPKFWSKAQLVTRSKLGAVKPNPKYALNTITSSNIPCEPHNVRNALAHHGWKAAMDEELAALHKNETWLINSTSLCRWHVAHWINSNTCFRFYSVAKQWVCNKRKFGT